MTEDINNIPDEFEPEFEDELEQEVLPDPLLDPTQVITLRTSGGETRYIPTLEPITLADVPLGVLEHVIDETIRRHRFNTVPILAIIFDILKECHPDYQVEEYIHTRPHLDAAQKARIKIPTPEEYKKSWLKEK